MRNEKLVWACLVVWVGCQDLRSVKERDDESAEDASVAADAGGDDNAAGSGGANAGRGGSVSSGGSGGAAASSGSDGVRAGDSDAGGVEASIAFEVNNLPSEVVSSVTGDLVFNSAFCGDDPTIDTTTGKIDGCGRGMADFEFVYKEITQPDTSLGTLSAGLFVTRRFVIEQGMRVTVTGNRPLIVVALDEAIISGQLAANADSDTARGGGFGVTEDGQAGLGPGGGGRPNGQSGAGGGGFCGRGGPGGMHDGLVGQGGAPYGNPELVPLIGGSSGGMVHSYGSAGGGAIQISAGRHIEVSALGAIHVGGGGPGWAGNGGGAGGAILLEAPTVRVLGRLAANGGGGSAGASGGGSGPSGADGAADDQPAIGGRIEGVPSGGNGSAAGMIDGQAGGPVPSDSKRYGGGGGGGAGRIRINVAEGEPDITEALISPSVDTPCFTTGVLN